MIITRAKNVWIKFILFIHNMWEKKYSALQGNTWKVLRCQ